MPSLPFLHSIRARLVLLVVTAVSVATLAIGALSLWQATARYAGMKHETLFSTARVLAAAAARGVEERDIRGLYESLRAIGQMDGVTYVAVTDSAGKLLADLGATEQLVGDLVLDETSQDMPIMALLTSRSIELGVPIVRGGAVIGRLAMHADTADLGARLRAAASTTLAGSLIALALGLIVALRMQSAISRPLSELTGAMTRVSSAHDYAVNVEAPQAGEIGVLARGFNAMLVDIRERDDKLATHRVRLEQEVAQRTADLVAARDAAQEASSQKSQFLATMSHEIRTPMNGMLVMAELLASSELPPRARRYAEVVSRSGQSLLAIINDILDFSKIEAGKLELERIVVDPAECAEMVVNLFHERARSMGLDLVARIDVDVPEKIEADPVRLNQVLGNLVNNALKFTETGGVAIRISVDPGEPTRVHFSVRDTGVGIAGGKLDAIFEVFTQADQSTTRSHGGTGLGLAICRRLVQAMGGDIRATSETGRGSNFFFSLPCAVSDAPALQCAPLKSGRRQRALVAMDATLSADALRHYLEAAGYDIVHDDASIGAADLVIADATALERSGAPRAGRNGFVVVLGELGDTAAERCLAHDLADILMTSPVARAEILTLVARLARGEEPAGAQSAGAANAVARYDGAKILVADDSPVNREVAIEALARFGVTPDVVEDGERAVEACAARRYDLVLMDGSMPILDGFEATRRIRDAERGGRLHTPIVALTAQVIGAGAGLWKAAGMDGVLHKPFTMARLADVLAAHLQPCAQGDRLSTGFEDRPATPVIDASALESLNVEASGNFASRVIGLYCEHAPKSAQDIGAYVACGDLASLGSAAHALKSMSLTIGARQVAACAGEIETLARARKQMPDADLLRRLAQQVAAACDALAAVRKAA